MTDNTQGIPGQKGLTSGQGEFNRINFHVGQLLGKRASVRVVKVVKVKNGGGAVAEAGRLTVKQLVNQVDGLGKPQEHGNTFDIPYIRVQGGKNAVIIDPEVGDIGLIVVADRDISKVKKTKKEENPGTRRRNDVSDGLYIGGILNAVPEQWVRFFADGMELHDKNGNTLTLMKDGGKKTIKADTDQLVCTGEVIAKYGGASVTLSGHQHDNSGGVGLDDPPQAGT